jgi:hypothetical protein
MNKELSPLSRHIADASGIAEQGVANALHLFWPRNRKARQAVADKAGVTLKELGTIEALSIEWHRAHAMD